MGASPIWDDKIILGWKQNCLLSLWHLWKLCQVRTVPHGVFTRNEIQPDFLLENIGPLCSQLLFSIVWMVMNNGQNGFITHYGLNNRPIFLPPTTKLGQGNIFRSVCQEFCSHLGAVHTGRYRQQAGGTHPTGMHTCFSKKIRLNLIMCERSFSSLYFQSFCIYGGSDHKYTVLIL